MCGGKGAAATALTGPPEFPGLIAASICTVRIPMLLTSSRLTTPRVTEMFVPPVGKPTQVTLSSRAGRVSESCGQQASQAKGC